MQTVAASNLLPGQTLYLGSAVLTVLSVALAPSGVTVQTSRVLMTGQSVVVSYLVSGNCKVRA